MLAARLPGILPPMDPAEILEVSMIASVAGLLTGGGITRRRPFRNPHHSASMVALTGGGFKARRAMEMMKLTARGYHRVLRVACTLADLDRASGIGQAHIAEALSYRQKRPSCPEGQILPKSQDSLQFIIT